MAVGRGSRRDLNVESVTAAGTTQATAADIKAGWSPALILATGNGTVGVKLPPASKGRLFYVKNLAAASTLNIYPNTSDAINALGSDTVLTIAAATTVILVASSASQWYTVPLLPS